LNAKKLKGASGYGAYTYQVTYVMQSRLSAKKLLLWQDTLLIEPPASERYRYKEIWLT